MSTNFDDTQDATPRDENQPESLEDLRTRRASKVEELAVEDEANLDENLELPGADLSGEELVIEVVPQGHDEFTCTRCFLVQHRSRRVSPTVDVCHDCD